MILLKQKRKTYTPPEIEVTEYEVEDSLADVSGIGHDQEGSDEWSKSSTFLDDPEDGITDDWGNDFDYESYRSEMLW